jgi:protein phosphatase
MEVAVLSDAGKREENQDWMSWSRIPWGECYIVADGMGGYKGGALAARMTVEGLERHLKSQPPEWPFDKALQEAARRTNTDVYSAAQSGNPEMDRMGSTVAVALVSGGNLHTGHIGDSRIYLFRGRQLKLLTTDHTSVQRMVEAGMLTPEQAREHPEAHILSRAVGSKADVEIEIGGPFPLQPGDGILICSDGLTGYVTDKQIEKVLARQSDVQRVPKQLLELALQSGSDDNITVQFVRYGRHKRKKRHTAKLASLPDAGRVDQVHDFVRGLSTKRGAVVALMFVAVLVAVPVLRRSGGPPVQSSPGPQPPAPDTSRPELPASPPADIAADSQPASNRSERVKTLTAVPPGTTRGATTKLVREPGRPQPPSPGGTTRAKPESSKGDANRVQTGPEGASNAITRTGSKRIRVVILSRGAKTEAGIVAKALKKSGNFAPEASSGNFGEPPSEHFIFYPRESAQAARRLEELLRTNTPLKRWKRGPYQGGRIKQYRQKIERQGERHLLVVFPKGK